MGKEKPVNSGLSAMNKAKSTARREQKKQKLAQFNSYAAGKLASCLAGVWPSVGLSGHAKNWRCWRTEIDANELDERVKACATQYVVLRRAAALMQADSNVKWPSRRRRCLPPLLLYWSVKYLGIDAAAY